MRNISDFVQDNAGWILEHYTELDIANIQKLILNYPKDNQDKLHRRNMQIKELKKKQCDRANWGCSMFQQSKPI